MGRGREAHQGSTEHGVTYLKPKDTATRAQIATVMLNFYNTFAEDEA